MREELAQMRAVLDSRNSEVSVLHEQLDTWRTMFARDDVNWLQFNGDVLDSGPSLDAVKDWSLKLRQALSNVHMKRGLQLRTNYIWGGGIHYGTLPSGRGVKNVQTWINDPINQFRFFGALARQKRESAFFTDGHVFYRGFTRKDGVKSLEPIPLRQITATMRNPDQPDEVWAYRREYIRNNGNGKTERRVEWRYTDTFIGLRSELFIPIVKGETVITDEVIFDFTVNAQIGHAFGVPDSLAAMAWAQVYRNFMMNGKVMSDALAQFAFRVVTNSKRESQAFAAKLATPTEAGSTVIASNAIDPISTAGKGYDFESGRPILAIVASALEVSVIALASDPGSKSAGQGTAQTLDLPTRLAVESRRQLHIESDQRVLAWMGVPLDKMDISFQPLDDSAEAYRKIQSIVMGYDRGLFQPDLTAGQMADIVGIRGNKPAADIVQPGTEGALNTGASAPTDLKTGPQAANPNQGQSSAAGADLNNSNDLRDATAA